MRVPCIKPLLRRPTRARGSFPSSPSSRSNWCINNFARNLGMRPRHMWLPPNFMHTIFPIVVMETQSLGVFRFLVLRGTLTLLQLARLKRDVDGKASSASLCRVIVQLVPLVRQVEPLRPPAPDGRS